MAVSVVFFFRSPWLLNRNSGVHFPVCWFFLLHRIFYVSNYTGCPQLYSPVLAPLSSIRRPFITFKLPRGDMDTPPRLLPISSDRDVSLPLTLEWPVWSSSSGNNCHPVQRSLSSGASAYESIMRFFFYLDQFHQPISTHAISSHNCHQNVSLPSGASPWIAFLTGSKGQNITLIASIFFL